MPSHCTDNDAHGRNHQRAQPLPFLTLPLSLPSSPAIHDVSWEVSPPPPRAARRRWMSLRGERDWERKTAAFSTYPQPGMEEETRRRGTSLLKDYVYHFSAWNNKTQTLLFFLVSFAGFGLLMTRHLTLHTRAHTAHSLSTCELGDLEMTGWLVRSVSHEPLARLWVCGADLSAGWVGTCHTSWLQHPATWHCNRDHVWTKSTSLLPTR